ncbi:MAG: ribosomal RNA small subunit methyltransferase A [Candidatus Doudnabacteria bacterium]|nr:ribosomal RNA small subunit methyltransferase A [Candidatus Doudnabacteria bacterium]
MNVEQLKNLLRSNGLKPNFTYGQNFLIDEIALQDIVDSAGITNKTAVLEIGPGIGNMTKLLCERAGFVLAIEKDPKFVQILHNIKKDFRKNFRFEIADALEFNFQDFFKDEGFDSYIVVANIPYYITGKILQMLMTAKFKPDSITVLTQKEVAQNVCAKAGDLSVLAISVQLFGTPELVQVVPARSFYPAPKVDSAVLKITLDKKQRYDIADEKRFFKIVKACFSGKRKQIHNTLANNLGIEKTRAMEILSELRIKPASRPQELTIEDWIRLVEKIK